MTTTWQRYTEYYCEPEGLGLALDISRMMFPDGFLASMEQKISSAYDAMEALEAGAIANPDENRQVGHYWLRNPGIAPNEERHRETVDTVVQVRRIAADVHEGRITPPAGDRFTDLLVIGIGGSALGPQLACEALRSSNDRMRLHFFDNTDPDGMDTVLAGIGNHLKTTLVLVISKSGGTKETRNGMLEAQAAFKRVGLEFARQAIAITGAGSRLDKVAEGEGWIERVPMFDYIGGRTSEMSAVGLLPAALQGIDIDEMLSGAAAMDVATRNRETSRNPAALLALMWHYATRGHGERDMVVLPYKDRLLLMSKYLQQLVMESLGKERDLDGSVVNQGISVYGNKGSTDQHAYVQQLRDGVNNFFAVFIEVLKDRAGQSIEVEPNTTTGDFLQGFYLGTREALAQNGRESITITIGEVTPRSLGMLIALFERAVGLYATLVNINAYHQPGVEAGKKAAGTVLELQTKLLAALRMNVGTHKTAEEWATTIGESERVETVWKVLSHLAANGRGVILKGTGPNSRTFAM